MKITTPISKSFYLVIPGLVVWRLQYKYGNDVLLILLE